MTEADSIQVVGVAEASRLPSIVSVGGYVPITIKTQEPVLSAGVRYILVGDPAGSRLEIKVSSR